MGAALMQPKTKTFLRTNLRRTNPRSSVLNRLLSACNRCKNGRHVSNPFRIFTAYDLRKLRDVASCLQSKNAPETGTANARTGNRSSQGKPQASRRFESSACDDKLYNLALDLFWHIRRLATPDKKKR